MPSLLRESQLSSDIAQLECSSRRVPQILETDRVCMLHSSVWCSCLYPLQQGRLIGILRFEQGSFLDGLKDQGSNGWIRFLCMNIHLGKIRRHTEIPGFIQQGSGRLTPVNKIERRNIRIIVIARS